MGDIAEIIGRLEKAGGPDEDLDFAISRAISGDHIAKYSSAHLHYTSSLDNALTLLRPGYGAVSASINERGQSSMRIGHPYVYGNGSTPAIALCIAALKSLRKGAGNYPPRKGEIGNAGQGN